MVQKIASLIDETLMAMNAHLHVQMTHEEKAYLDAHFELIHIKKGEYLMNRGDEVDYLYYLEAGTIRLSFPDKEKREISARFIEPKEFINFSLSHKEQLSHYNMKALEHCKVWRLPKRDLQRLYDLSINFNKLARLHLEKSINHKIKREEDFHKLNAEERYKKLMANERWMFRSIPLKDIASLYWHHATSSQQHPKTHLNHSRDRNGQFYTTNPFRFFLVKIPHQLFYSMDNF